MRAAQGDVTLYSAYVMSLLKEKKHNSTRRKRSRVGFWDIPSSPRAMSILLLHDAGPRPDCEGDVFRFQDVPVERVLLHAIRK